MNPVRLFLVAPGFYPTHGGAELRFLRYLPILQEMGVQTEVITGTPKRKKMSLADVQADWMHQPYGTLLPQEVINGIIIHRIRLPDQGAKKRSKYLFKEVLSRCDNPSERPDVIQLLSPLPVSSVKSLKKLQSYGIKLVYAYALAKSFSKISAKRALQKFGQRKLYLQMDCIITASSVLRNMLLDLYPADQIKVIPNGVDTDKFIPLSSEEDRIKLRQRLGLPEESFFITLVGSIHPRKGTHLLVKAWAKLVREYDNLHLVLIGSRFDQLRNELAPFRQEIESTIARIGKTNQVHFLGQVDNVSEYLQISDLFVFPSEKEGMPNAVLEAMATALPVVMTPFIGLSDDFGTPEREYLLAERNVEDLQQAISTLLVDDNMRKQLGKNAREWICRTMQLQRCVKCYADVYRSLSLKDSFN